jgi:hypothetical protein
MGEGRGVHRVLVGKPEGKRPLGRPRRKWEDNIKMDLLEVGGGCRVCVRAVQRHAHTLRYAAALPKNLTSSSFNQ